MPRKPKESNVVAFPLPEPIKPSNEFCLRDRTFKVVAFRDREDDKAYDDSVEFTVRSVPLITKIMGVMGTVDSFGIMAPDASFDSFSSSIVEDMDLGKLLAELGYALPDMVAIICHATDPMITPTDVKKLAGSLTNIELLRAVFLQFAAENLGEQLKGLKSAFSGSPISI